MCISTKLDNVVKVQMTVHTHIPPHKHNTACWGEGQYYSVEMLREEQCLEFVFEGRES